MNLDQAIQAYYQLHGMGQDLVDSNGRVYAPACENCGHGRRDWREGRDEPWVCAGCGAEWPFAEVQVLKGVVCRASRGGRPIPAPRVGEFERRLADLAHLGHHLNSMLRDDYWRWGAQVLVGHALTSLGYAEIAEFAALHEWPAPGTWTEARARWCAGRARGELRRRLATRKSEAPSCRQSTRPRAEPDPERSNARRRRDPRFMF